MGDNSDSRSHILGSDNHIHVVGGVARLSLLQWEVPGKERKLG